MAFEVGKGSARRPSEVSKEQFAENWNRIFGKKTKASERIEIGDRVKANRDGNGYVAGQTGTVEDDRLLDSDIYLFICLDSDKDNDAKKIGPVSESYWNKI